MSGFEESSEQDRMRYCIRWIGVSDFELGVVDEKSCTHQPWAAIDVSFSRYRGVYGIFRGIQAWCLPE